MRHRFTEAACRDQGACQEEEDHRGIQVAAFHDHPCREEEGPPCREEEGLLGPYPGAGLPCPEADPFREERHDRGAYREEALPCQEEAHPCQEEDHRALVGLRVGAHPYPSFEAGPRCRVPEEPSEQRPDHRLL